MNFFLLPRGLADPDYTKRGSRLTKVCTVCLHGSEYAELSLKYKRIQFIRMTTSICLYITASNRYTGKEVVTPD